MRNLAATYRPRTLDEVVGQEQAKTVLRRHLEIGPKSGYCCVGGAGSGKTTCARIFAYALNHGKTNVLEMNAANTNSVEDIRQLIETAKKKPIGTPYRIFILDECHMLTNQAQNALLKLLEEPPPTVVIFMCTTDPRKILPTIMSRVLRLDFTRIDVDLIQRRLEWVLQQEGLTEYDPNALKYVAQLANGGMRDALSMMDKVVAYDAGITMDIVNQALGLVGFDKSFELLGALLGGDAGKVLDVMNNLNTQGADFKITVQDFRRFMLNAVKVGLGVDHNLIPMPETEINRFKQYQTGPKLFRILARVNEIVPKTTYDPDPYTLLCTEFIRMVGEL